MVDRKRSAARLDPGAVGPQFSSSRNWASLLRRATWRADRLAVHHASAVMNPASLFHPAVAAWFDRSFAAPTAAQVQALLNDDDIVTLNELPTMPWSSSAPIVGDFNRNGSVDAADYVVWRKSLGQTAPNLAADIDLNGKVDAGDYAIWRSQFGRTANGGSASSIPEPCTVGLAVALVCTYVFSRKGAKAQ